MGTNKPVSKQVHSMDHGSIPNFAMAHTTPMYAAHKPYSAPVKPVAKMAPIKAPPHSGANAQTDAVGRAMKSAQKNTKTFGLIDPKYR